MQGGQSSSVVAGTAGRKRLTRRAWALLAEPPLVLPAGSTAQTSHCTRTARRAGHKVAWGLKTSWGRTGRMLAGVRMATTEAVLVRPVRMGMDWTSKQTRSYRKTWRWWVGMGRRGRKSLC